MTTTVYKDVGKGASLLSGYGSYTLVSSYARKVANHWQQWQAAREIESMPFEVRKDLGWPSTDTTKDRKDMQ